MEQEEATNYIDMISQNKIKFQKYNLLRLSKLSNSLTNKRIMDLIDALPLLITSNNPGLPGYVDNYQPIGIHGYSPSSKAVNFLKARFRSVQLKGSDEKAQPLIELFAIMGSAGSIAYNEESDIDFWICLDEKKVGEESLESLMTKLRGIELWITENFNIETYFFVNDIEKIRNDLFDTSEDSFSGKANGKLLKDEFYRSSILLNGKIPFWWVVPSEIDDVTYIKYHGAMTTSDFSRDYVDFGNLYNIDKGDFLGGGLFQILKSLGNPFKSIIKMGIVERYLLEKNTETPLLCNIIKKNVHEERLEMDHIDPYILMFNQVNDFYSTSQDTDLLMASEIIKMCFYIKIDPNLTEITSSKAQNTQSEKILKMQEYTKSWLWSNTKLKQMDTFKDWDITPINKFWNNITKHILKSYKRILENIKGDTIAQKFSAEDIKFITRKINSSFSLASNKIRPAVTFKDNPIEKQLSIESVSEKDGNIQWLLSKGFKTGRTEADRGIIHKEPSLVALLAWISMNRMFQKDHTRVDTKSRYHLLDSSFVSELMNQLTLHFSIKRLHIENEYFFIDPFPLLNFIIINLYSKYPKGIEDIFFLHHNSWGETVYERYESETDLSGILVRLLNGALHNREDYNRCVHFSSPLPYGASKEFKEIQFLFRDTYDLFIGPLSEEHIEKKYITMLANNFTAYSYKKIKGEYKIAGNIYDSELKMLYSLSSVTGRQNIIKINPKHSELNYLRVIVENFKKEAIQIYYQQERKYCYFFISDEQGSMIFYRESTDVFLDYLTRLYMFSKNVIKNVKSNNPDSSLNQSEENIEIFKLERDARNKCTIKEIDRDLKKDIVEHEKTIVPFCISLGILKTREIGYRYSLPFGSQSDTFTKSEIGKIAKDLGVYMDITQGYNFFITDVDLSSIDHNVYKNATSYSFAEKNRLELLIERILANLGKVKK